MHFFAIPALHPEDAQAELNAFCAAQRVVAIERQFVAAGAQSYWALCVVVAHRSGPAAHCAEGRRPPVRRMPAAAARIDYREVLSTAEFAVYAALRAWRKTAAEAARTGGRTTDAAAQRAYDGLLATLATTQSLHFRRRLCRGLDDDARRTDILRCKDAGRDGTRPTAPCAAAPGSTTPGGAVAHPQREPPGQRRQQPGLSPVPELDAGHSAETGRRMDQTAHPDLGSDASSLGRRGEQQGARGAGRGGRGCSAPNAPRVADARRSRGL